VGGPGRISLGIGDLRLQGYPPLTSGSPDEQLREAIFCRALEILTGPLPDGLSYDDRVTLRLHRPAQIVNEARRRGLSHESCLDIMRRLPWDDAVRGEANR